MQRRNRNKIIISSLVILGVLMIMWSSLFERKDRTNDSYEQYVSKLECKLEEFLKNIDGIRDADVIITLDEYSTDDDSTSVSWSNSSVNNNTLPRVRGVAVACTNGDKYDVQITVTEIVSKYLGIPTNKIKIALKK